MFSKATANFVRQIDKDGSLIHVSRVNDSCKLVPMALVVKRRRLWFWQRPKYQPTDFTLGNLLLGDKELSPGVCDGEFLSYKGTFGDKLSGKLDTKAGAVSVELEGRGTSELQSCFGELRKQELDVKKLLRDSSGRLVDMQHVLVQQLKKRTEVLAIVKDRILTTNSGRVTQTIKEQCTFQGVLGLVGMLASSVKDSNNIEVDSDVSLEIPSHTVIAYSVLELEIKKDGRYNVCLQPGTIGGFEADSSAISCPSPDPSNDIVDGKFNGEHHPEKVPLRAQQNGSQEVELSPLAELPQLTRRALFQELQETMKDRTALSYLQCVLEELCGGETLDPAEREEQFEGQRDSVSAGPECSRPASAAHLHAAHLLVSAIEELPDETLSVLSESRADFLGAFDTLVCRLKESVGPLPVQRLPVPLLDNQAFQLAEQLLGSTSVTLKRNSDTLWTETGEKAEVLPLLLCLSVRGLSLLCNGPE